MRTTLNLSDHLMRRIRDRAVREGQTMTAVIEEVIDAGLRATAPAEERFRLRLVTFGDATAPAVDVQDRDALLDFMDEQR